MNDNFGKCFECRVGYGMPWNLGPILLCERHAVIDLAPIVPPYHPTIENILKGAIKDRLALVFAEEKLKTYERWQDSWMKDRAKVRDWLKSSGLWQKALDEGAVEEDGPAIA